MIIRVRFLLESLTLSYSCSVICGGHRLTKPELLDYLITELSHCNYYIFKHKVVWGLDRRRITQTQATLPVAWQSLEKPSSLYISYQRLIQGILTYD